MRFTEAALRNLKPPASGRQVYQHVPHRGLDVRFSYTIFKATGNQPTGKRSFTMQRRLHTTPTKIVLPASTLEEAGKLAREAHNFFLQDIHPYEGWQRKEKNAPTFSELFDVYLEERDLRPKTVEHYKTCLNLMPKKYRNTKINLFTDATILNMYNQRMRDVQEAFKNRNTPKTWDGITSTKTMMRVAKAIFKFARNHPDYKHFVEKEDFFGVLDTVKKVKINKTKRKHNPVMKTDLPALVEAIFKDAEIREVQGAKHASLIRDFLFYCLFTGLRLSNARSMELTPRDGAEAYISGKNKFVVPVSKSGRELACPLSDIAVAIKDRRAIISKEHNSKYLFYSPYSKTKCLNNPNSTIKRIKALCNLNFSTHDLRATYIHYAKRHSSVSDYMQHSLTGHTILQRFVDEGYDKPEPDDLAQAQQNITDSIIECSGFTKKQFLARLNKGKKTKLKVATA